MPKKECGRNQCKDLAAGEARPACCSITEMTQMVLPNDANILGNVLGGMVMHWVDLAAAIAARRFCGTPVVTASMDSLSFLNPIPVGQVARLTARVTWCGRTSMEIRVDVEAEDLDRREVRPTSVAYLTFVSLDESGRPTPVPRLITETEEEKQEFRAAEKRREARLKLRRQTKPKLG
jgi:acyl-CoA hydrolase